MLERRKPSGLGRRTVIGWREWLALPEWGIPRIRAKVDSGARSSALHVEALEVFQADGREWVRFSVATGSPDASPAVVEAPVHDRRPVMDSGGHVGERIFLLTRVELAGFSYPIEINLASRHGMSFPMLLGRTGLRRRFVVDPARSFRAGRVAGVVEALR
ncbi:MAG: ATP-dependent zinc protease [Proteobacteria bacterium]|nr:ATP-dependent zinc protease [Pseudomonadota bacterium]